MKIIKFAKNIVRETCRGINSVLLFIMRSTKHESEYVLFKRRLVLFISDINKVLRYGKVSMNRWIVDGRKNVAFLHVPQTGGTIVVNSIYDADESYEIFNISDGEKLKSGRITKNSRGTVVGKDVKFDGFKFAYVRNPFERLVSVYEHNIGKNDLYEVTYFGYLNVDSFEKWIERLVRIPFLFMEDHSSSQYAHIYSGENRLVTFVGKFEEINVSFPKIIKTYNLGEMIERKCVAKRKGSWMEYYNNHTAGLVYDKYKDDFEKFEYGDEYVKLLDYLNKQGS